MNDATRKRIERELAEKVLGWAIPQYTTPGPFPQCVWNESRATCIVFEDVGHLGRPWSPVTIFAHAWSLLGRLVEKDGEAEIEFSGLRKDESGQAWASVEIGNRDGGAWADTPAEALTLAICEVLGISMEDENGS